MAETFHAGNQHNLFLGSLRPSTNEEDIKSYLSQYGKILKVKLILDVITTKSKNCALVFCEDGETIDRILSQGDHTIDNKKIRVTKADDRKKGTKKINSRWLKLTNSYGSLALRRILDHFSEYGVILGYKIIEMNNILSPRVLLIHYKESSSVSKASMNFGTAIIDGMCIDSAAVEINESKTLLGGPDQSVENLLGVSRSQENWPDLVVQRSVNPCTIPHISTEGDIWDITQRTTIMNEEEIFWNEQAENMNKEPHHHTQSDLFEIQTLGGKVDRQEDLDFYSESLRLLNPESNLLNHIQDNLSRFDVTSINDVKQRSDSTNKKLVFVHLVEFESDELFKIFCSTENQQYINEDYCNSSLKGAGNPQTNSNDIQTNSSTLKWNQNISISSLNLPKVSQVRLKDAVMGRKICDDFRFI